MPTMINLWGEEIIVPEPSKARRKPTVKKGYAAMPGTGPEGETCKTCEHCKRFGGPGGGKHFIKCNLMKRAWTSGEGTDILARSPACRNWEKAKDKTCQK